MSIFIGIAWLAITTFLGLLFSLGETGPHDIGFIIFLGVFYLFGFFLLSLGIIHKKIVDKVEVCYGKVMGVSTFIDKISEETKYNIEVMVIIDTEELYSGFNKTIVSDFNYNVGEYVQLSKNGNDFIIDYVVNEDIVPLKTQTEMDDINTILENRRNR